MGGISNNRESLNRALKKISTILNKSTINDWFISYGTLLGIIREESCIEGDDDVDINISVLDRMQLYFLLIGNGFEIWIDRPDFIKTIPTEDVGSIDFYFCKMNQEICEDTWNKIIWNNYKNKDGDFLNKEWDGAILNIPFNPEDKLKAKYGNWKVPSEGNMGGDSPYNLP
jgi:phosphorylcholine metabolism protein LicD